MKNIVLSLILAATSLNVNGQLLDFRGHGGVGILSVTSDTKSNIYNGESYSHYVTSDPLIQFGVAATIGKRLFLQPGVTWQSVVLTNTNVNDATNKTFDDEVKLSMITVPIKVGIRVINPDDIHALNLRLFGGVDGQFVTAADHSSKSGLIPDIKKEDFNKMITYLDFGMGVDVLFLFADVGYRIGISPVASSGDNSKANMFYTNVGVKFSL